MSSLPRKVVTAIGLLVCLLCVAWWTARTVTDRDRIKWKDLALARLANLSLTNEQIRLELAALTEVATKTNNDLGWAHDHVLQMTNGEFIVYEYRHGRNDYFPPHLFLGRASNGQWLYSSYHFCNNMNMVRYDQPPGSVAEFARAYSARSFDGKSDECLKLTR